MSKRIIRALASIFILIAWAPVHAAVSVFTCEPEWAALTEVVGGPDVRVSSATTGRQDPHFVQARPSLIAKVRNADLLVCTGAGLEQGWLPVLLRKARNPRVQPGQPGYLEAANHVALLDIPERLDRAEGDIHAQGNPHIQTDPRRLLTVAQVIAARLTALDPGKADDYRKRLADFEARWQRKIADWQQQAAHLKGKRVVVHHREWIYLLDWLGMERAATLEPKPGVDPSAGYLAQLKDALDERPAAMIIRSSLGDPRPARWLSDQTGIPVMELPQTVGAAEGAEDLDTWFEMLMNRLSGAAQ